MRGPAAVSVSSVVVGGLTSDYAARRLMGDRGHALTASERRRHEGSPGLIGMLALLFPLVS